MPCYIRPHTSIPASIPTDRSYEFGNPSTFSSLEALRSLSYEDFSSMRHYSYNYVDFKHDIIVINDTPVESLLDYNLQFSPFHKLGDKITSLAIILPDGLDWDPTQIRRYLNRICERILRGCHGRKNLWSLKVIFQKAALASHVLLDSAEGEDTHVVLKVKLLRALDHDYLRRSRPRKIRPPLLQFVRVIQAP